MSYLRSWNWRLGEITGHGNASGTQKHQASSPRSMTNRDLEALRFSDVEAVTGGNKGYAVTIAIHVTQRHVNRCLSEYLRNTK